MWMIHVYHNCSIFESYHHLYLYQLPETGETFQMVSLATTQIYVRVPQAKPYLVANMQVSM